MKDWYVHMRRARVWVMLCVFSALATGCATVQNQTEVVRAPKNIIILYGDGAAATQWELGRYASRALRGKPFVITDIVFREGALGLMSTYSADSMVTDSAAAGTALSTGHKTDNGMTGVTPNGDRVRTVMEAAKARGKRIGLVTTAEIYDASPAAFSVHAKSRREAQAIVDQYLALEPDVLLGGGRNYFLPKGAGSGRRDDGRDIMAAFASKGYAVVQDPVQLKAATGRRVLGLFADRDMDFELDRDSAKQPSTAEMMAAAIRILSADSPNGFVLFVENESTDTAGHQNDAAALIRDLWALDDAVQVALDFRKRAPEETLILVTGDHETGGLSVTYALREIAPPAPGNRLSPDDSDLRMIAGIRMSLDHAAKLLGRKPSSEMLDKVIAEAFPGFRLDPDLRTAILEGRPLERTMFYMPHGVLARMISRQTGFYWGTMGHTTEPVAVGALGPGAPLFRGYMDNTDFGKILQKLIDTGP